MPASLAFPPSRPSDRPPLRSSVRPRLHSHCSQACRPPCVRRAADQFDVVPRTPFAAACIGHTRVPTSVLARFHDVVVRHSTSHLHHPLLLSCPHHHPRTAFSTLAVLLHFAGIFHLTGSIPVSSRSRTSAISTLSRGNSPAMTLSSPAIHLFAEILSVTRKLLKVRVRKGLIGPKGWRRRARRGRGTGASRVDRRGADHHPTTKQDDRHLDCACSLALSVPSPCRRPTSRRRC